MFVLNEETKKTFQEERETCEAMGLTVAEMDAMVSEAEQVLMQVNEHIEALTPICDKYPFLKALIANSVLTSLSTLQYGYRLMENCQFQEDEPNQFKTDRKDLLLLIKQSFNEKKGMNA